MDIPGEGLLALAPCSRDLGKQVPPSALALEGGLGCERQPARQLSGREMRMLSAEEAGPQPDAWTGGPGSSGGQPSLTGTKLGSEGVDTPYKQDAGMAAAGGEWGLWEAVEGREEEEGGDAEQTEYERARAERIRRNREVMRSMGLGKPAIERRLPPKMPAPPRRKAHAAEREYPLRSRRRAAQDVNEMGQTGAGELGPALAAELEKAAVIEEAAAIEEAAQGLPQRLTFPAAAQAATPLAEAAPLSGGRAAARPTAAARPGKKRQRPPLPGSISLAVTRSNSEGGYLELQEAQLEYLGLRTAAEGGQSLLMAAPSGRCWIVEVGLSEQYGAGRQYVLQQGFGKLLEDLGVVEGDALRLWPVQQGPAGRHVVLDFELQRRRGSEEGTPQGSLGTERPAVGCPRLGRLEPFLDAPPAGAAQQAQQQEEGQGPAQQASMQAQPAGLAATPVLAAVQGEGRDTCQATRGDEEVSSQLLRLQRALWAAQLPPAGLAEFEMAWQVMAPHQRCCIYNALSRVAGPAGAAPSHEEATALRELAVRAMASLQHGGIQHGAASSSAAGGHDLHAALCELQGLLEVEEGLEASVLTQFELAWLGQRSAAWYASVGGMIRRAHAQGVTRLAQVLAAVVHSVRGS